MATPAAERAPRRDSLNIRIKADERGLIDRAAETYREDAHGLRARCGAEGGG